MPSHGRHSRSPSRGRTRKKPEVLQQLGRAVLSYSLSRLAKTSGSSSKKDKDRSHSRRRSRSHSAERGSSGPTRDNSDLHKHMTQLAAGVLAFGVKQYMAHRREKKKKSAASQTRQPPPQDRGLFSSGRRSDAELSSALGSLTAELQGTSEAIRRLARQPPSHRNCEVYQGLVANADRIQAQLENLQASANNMRNLHPGLARGREDGRREGRGGERGLSRGVERRIPPREDERVMPRERWRGEEEERRSDWSGRPRGTVGRERSRFDRRDAGSRRSWGG
ncbi:hypothetical protein B0T25DRAFT_618181 [Lasiosphaeria hispida]|uniref:Uncharacterized protein n=1 Tax=Lasiosphaeria hispida TaxID=260671 RepID=A0AAJ0M7L6_9PEZI|nr:hypothetical protein B0T25DRAFT_618181 [Lasiosphaeria hispida]